MNIPLVDLKAQYASIKPEIDAAIQRILDNTSFIMGQELAAFEEAFSTYMHVKHTIGVANGTDALLLAMVALGIGPGDEIITTPHTFVATVEPIIHRGARPVFVDIDPVTYNLDPAQIEQAITERTRAILPVHIYGQPANMSAIKAIADRHNLDILEDAAQAHGAEYDGRRVGSWSRLTGFSFYPGKNLGAYGDGGAITTNDDALAVKLRQLRDHGSHQKYAHVLVGYNSRLDAMQAAIMAVKLNYIEQWTEQRRRNAAYYTQALAGVPGVVAPAEDPQARHVYHLYVIQVPGDREAAFSFLRERGVGVGIHYPNPIHLQSCMADLGYRPGDFPHAEALCQRIISLPMYPELSTEAMDTVVAAVRAYAEQAI